MLTEPGHLPNRRYVDTDGEIHLNGTRLLLNETGRAIDNADVVATGAGTLALTVAAHGDRTVLADQAGGITYTLPSAVAAIVGTEFRIAVSVTLTGGSLILQVANASDYMVGLIQALSDDGAGGPMKGWPTANTGTVGTESDTITLNRTTTGTAVKGQELVAKCIAANVWKVSGVIAQSGTEATPFSVAV